MWPFICFIVFLIGRAIGTYLLRFINSGKLLLQFALMAAVCVLGTVLIEGIVGLYALIGISFFMSVMFPTIYGIALEDLDEKEFKIGAAGLVMAIVGGAFMPYFQGKIIDLGGSGVDDLNIFGISNKDKDKICEVMKTQQIAFDQNPFKFSVDNDFPDFIKNYLS